MATRVYRVLPVHRLTNNVVTHVLTCKVRLILNPTAIHTVNTTESLVKRKFGQLLQWYEEFTGLDEVRIAQNRVLEAEAKFVTAQERRREASTVVSAIQSKLKDLWAELDNTSRGEERYVHLITQEHSILKEEKRAVQEFQSHEREERECFAALSSAVKESHEKERAQAERTKYWSIIGSVIGTIIGIIGSSVNNQMKMKELRRLIGESLLKYGEQDISTDISQALSKHEKALSVIVREMQHMAAVPSDKVSGHQNELVHKFDNQVNSETGTVSNMIGEILKLLKNQEVCFDRNFQELKSVIVSQKIQIGDDQVVVLPYDTHERLRQQLRNTVTFCAIAAVVVPFLCKYFSLL